MTDGHSDLVPFAAHIELLRLFLARRKDIVEHIEGVLNAQRKPAQYLQDRPLLARHFEDCFFGAPGVTDDQTRLRGSLEQAHWDSGFRPRQVSGLHNDLIHPAEMMIRGFYCWQQTRWPGRNGRLRYAETLFNVYLLRCLVLLSMRIWDAGSDAAGARLGQIQALLDALWQGSPADQPALVRDARWLIPLAQSPTTDELAAYFAVAEHVAESLGHDDRLEVQKAGARMIGGHLTSQIRHYCLKDGVPLDDDSIVLRTRTSNALDFALLVQGLVPLLEAYEQALQSGNSDQRLEFAGAILQAISPDPEVFLDRVDLLGPYSMIEHLFVSTAEDGSIGYTSMGRRHVRLLREYAPLIGRLLRPLHEDCQNFRPADGSYSPYGAIFGTPSNLAEHMALKALQRDAETGFSLEDVFDAGNADRLAWVDDWRKLPHIPAEVQAQHAYPQQFAADIFARIEATLAACVSGHRSASGTRTGRLFIQSGDAAAAEPKESPTLALPVRYVGSSDTQIVHSGAAEAYDEQQLLRDRQEGYFVVSYATPGGWVAIKKDFLTEILATGRDARIAGLPPLAASVLSLMCPDLVVA